MRNKVQVALVAACILVLGLAPSVSAAAPHAAGLMIDYGNGTRTWIWVPFSSDEISMMEMLRSSDLDLVTVGFGGLGDAVCQIETTGCGVSECRTRMCQTSSASPFWRLLWLDDAEWRMAGNGAEGTMVDDGGVVAMSWSASMPTLPVVTTDDIAARVGVDPANAPLATVTQTFGETGSASGTTQSWLPAVGSLSVVVVAAGVVILRSRGSDQVVA
jgi:hypothetical protein